MVSGSASTIQHIANLQNMITTFIPRWVELRSPGANFPD